MDDWRAQLPSATRKRNINRIVKTLKKSHSFGDEDVLVELQKVAQNLEDKTYAGAASKSDYSQQISSKLRSMETSDWRVALQPDSRQRHVNRILDTLKRHLPVSSQDGWHELRNIAQRFEEETFTAATSQSDYLRKISLKMLTLEAESQGIMANNIPSNQVGPSNKPSDTVNLKLMDTNNWRPNQVTEPNMETTDWRGQLQPESRQRIVNKIMDTLKKHLPVSGQEGFHELWKIAQRFEEKIFTAAASQSDYLRKISLKMLNMEIKSQGTMANNIPSNQVGPSNKSPDPVGLAMQPQVHNPGQQRTIPLPNQPPSRQQPLSLNIQNNIASQPNLLPVSSLGQTSIQNVGQNSNMQNVSAQNSVGSTIGQNSNMQNMFATSQRQIPGRQQVVPQQQQQQSQNPQQLLFQQQPLIHKFQLQQQQQQQQQNLLQPNQLQSSQQSVMQPSMMQTSSITSIQHNPQPNNVQQSTQSMLQQHPQVIRQQQQQQTYIIHQQQTPITQQSILRQQQQQRLQASGSLLQQQTVLDQQKQLYQPQRPLPETSSASLDSTAQTGQPNGGDWQEEVFQKIKAMRESYLPELNEMYQKIATKLQQHDSLPQQPNSDQLEKLKVFKMMLECIITFLQVSKSGILPNFKEKLGSYEKQIINFINTNRPRKAMSSQQPGHLPPPHMHSMSQPQSQVTQVQSHQNQINSQLQTTTIQGSVATMQQNDMASMQHNSMSGVSTAQQNIMNSMQPGNSAQGNAVNSLQQVPVSSLEQNPVSAPQQTNINSLSAQLR